MDLFEYMRETNKEKESPLASRLRPTTLEEVVGQQHIIGKDKLLYRAIKADKLSSVIFYGPPGTGKTTLAKVIANTTSAEFTQINATVAGKKDMEEVAVIGMGPAGISAAIYLVRYGIVPTCFESNSIGGKLNSIGEIENYPSFIGEGKDLAKKMLDQVEHFKVKIVNQKVNKVSKNYDNGNYFVETDTDKYEFKAVIIATGIREKPFEVKGAKEINYKGISRCATCDGMFYRGKDVALLGSSLLAYEDALFLARLVNKVYLIDPNEKSNVKEELLNEVKSKPNIEIINGSNIVKVEGENSLERVVIDAEDATSTIMIEDLYDSVKRISDSIKECYISGDILNVEGVKRVSSDMIKELFN